MYEFFFYWTIVADERLRFFSSFFLFFLNWFGLARLSI